MFDTIGEAAKYIATIGEMQISYADKNLFKIAAAIDIAYNKGRLEILSEREDPDSIAEVEDNLRISRECMRQNSKAL